MENEQGIINYYHSAKVKHYDMGDAKVAVRIYGHGPALVFIHGYPVHGYTWRKLLPTLAKNNTCYVIDIPGLGDSQWGKDTDFSFTAQAKRLSELFNTLLPDHYTLIAHDTGATLARLITLANTEHVDKLVIINTEIPGHRPPWIRCHQWLAKIPGALLGFRLCMSSPLFLRSSMGMRELFSNKNLHKDPNTLKPYVDPLVRSPMRLFGAIAYLKGIEWNVVDSLRAKHNDITADVLFLWGADDRTFPIRLGKEMSKQFGGKTEFVAIDNSSLLPHEEQAPTVLKYLTPFLTRT